MPSSFKNVAGWRWVPDADPVGAPEGALLRATNVTPDETGTLSLRGGSEDIYSSLGTRINSLYTAVLQKRTFRYSDVDGTLYIDGSTSGNIFSGGSTLDSVFGDDSYQMFCARGTTKYKHDGTNTYNWGIARPTKKATLTGLTRLTKEVASFDSDELPAFEANEGTIAFTDDYAGTSNGAMTLEVNEASGIASATRHYATDQDFLNLSGFEGGSTDVFDMRVWLENPRKVDKVTIMFGLDDFRSDSESVTLTSSGTTATVTQTAHPLSTGDVVVITGATTHTEFNGIFSITKTGADTYTYTMASATTPTDQGDSGTSTYVTQDPFRDNYYYFDFNIRNRGEVDNKDTDSTSVEAYRKSANRLISQLSIDEITAVKTPEQAGDIMRRIGGAYIGSTTTARADSTAASPAWGHFSVTRGQFKRVGDSDEDWEDVTAFKIVYHAVPGSDTSTKKIGLDDAVWAGSGNRSLTGRFKVAYRYARRVLDDDGDLVYTELSPLSPASEEINLKQQTLQVTIPEAALTSADPQVDTIWIYLFGGWLDTFYRAAIVSSSINQGLTIDELTNPGGGEANFDTPRQRTRLSAHGFTYVQEGTEVDLSAGELTSSSTTATVTHANTLAAGDYVLISYADQEEYNGVYMVQSADGSSFTYTFAGSATSPATIDGGHGDPDNPGVITFVPLTSYPLGSPAGTISNDLTVSIVNSEVDLMVENKLFEPGSVGPPDGIVGIAGPWQRRIFVLTDKGWLYPSSIESPSSFSLYHAIDLRRYGKPLWVIGSTNGIFVGCSKDIIRIAGTGDESEDHVTVDLFPQPMGIGNPPVDEAVVEDSNIIIYRAADGPMMLVGSSLQAIPFAGTELLWRGYTRHGIEPLDIAAGRFRFATDNHNLYMLAPEGVESASSVSISRVTTTATVTHSSHGFSTGDRVLIQGANDSLYNGTKVITVVDTNSYTFSVSQGAETPATGTITATLVKDPNAIWKYIQERQQWVRFTYGSESILSIEREPDGQLIIGTKTGDVKKIELGDQDSPEEIYVDILTPIDDMGNPLARKDPADFQIHCYTAGGSGTAAFFTGGNNVASASISFDTTLPTVYRSALTSLGTFLKCQTQIYGTFQQFKLSAFGMTYRPLPEQVMVYDTGHIVAPRQDLAWINEVEIDVQSPSDLQMQIWKNGVLFDTLDIPVTANIRDKYRVVCPRGTKGRRLRLVFVTTASADEGNVGFEPYGIAVRYRGSGNFTELPMGQGDQGNV